MGLEESHIATTSGIEVSDSANTICVLYTMKSIRFSWLEACAYFHVVQYFET